MGAYSVISCTEFIPSYSELFSFLEEKHGREEVSRFWEYLFQPSGTGIPLISFLEKEGIRGCLRTRKRHFTYVLTGASSPLPEGRHERRAIVPSYCLHCD